MGDEGKAGAELRERAVEWLVSLDCGTADEQAFEAWRSADPRHAAAFAQAAATWRRTADPRLAVMLDQSADVDSAAEMEPAPVAPRKWSRRAVTGSAIAAVLGVGGAGAFLAWPRRAYASTAVGERQAIRLPDGSHAMLNTDTRVAWRFDGEREFWIEQGEAALLVRDAGKPFRVYSDPIDAHLSSGRFDFRLGIGSGQLLVLAGTATATPRHASAETIQAGSALIVGEAAPQIARLSPDEIAAATAWENGRIVFNGMPLDQAIAEFNRYLPEKIVLQDADLATTRLGGEFQTDDPDGFLLALRDGFDIGHREQGNQILLFRNHGR